MGDLLGGLPLDRTCYTDGKVDYNKLKNREFFIEGLKRLQNANSKGFNVCILCSESNPKECHRAKLIGVELQKMGIELRHIIGIEKEKTQNQVIFELTNGDGLNTIFGEEHFTSRKKIHLIKYGILHNWGIWLHRTIFLYKAKRKWNRYILRYSTTERS